MLEPVADIHRYHIALAPFGKQAPRFSRGRAYKHPKTAQWEGQAERMLRAQRTHEPIQGPVGMRIVATCAPPAKSSKATIASLISAVWALLKPDVDNIQKCVLDACTQAELWDDDKQVTRLHIEKVICESWETPSVHLEVWALKPTDLTYKWWQWLDGVFLGPGPDSA